MAREQTPPATTVLTYASAAAVAAAEAGINGLNKDSLNTFANLCGIAHSGGSGSNCRRLARSSRRSSGSSRRSTVRSNRNH